EDETLRPSPQQPPAAAPAEPRPPARPAPGPSAPKREKPKEDTESRKVLTNGAAKARPELAQDAVTSLLPAGSCSRGLTQLSACAQCREVPVRRRVSVRDRPPTLLSAGIPALPPQDLALRLHKEELFHPKAPGPASRLLPNGAGKGLEGGREPGSGPFPPLAAPGKPPRKLQSHHSINSQGSKKSKGSSKSASSHIPIEAQEDCCVHCILSCLFCEFLTLCNIVLDCATCGSCTSEDSCICCCCCNSGECADCDLPCDMDCGIIDACCESADCLEICMECCGLCFSS
ncbi:PREDICTED: myoD family inhibitor, partial [Tinamus guttatus]|uniref:myoD family inhibitor n=1 Tax=Tinamus guttatus TaxID=94827 RepID=UPI00052EFFFA